MLLPIRVVFAAGPFAPAADCGDGRTRRPHFGVVSKVR
jgi:hypothetical protein